MTDVNGWLTAKGTYILVLKMVESAYVTVGRLGTFKLNKGFYFYIGSAFGSGGLKARLRHHANPTHSPRWHIDYLKNSASLSDIIVSCSPVMYEHVWADILLNADFTQPTINRFGASDCNCPTHLFYSRTRRLANLTETMESDLRPDFSITRLKKKTWTCLLDY